MSRFWMRAPLDISLKSRMAQTPRNTQTETGVECRGKKSISTAVVPRLPMPLVMRSVINGGNYWSPIQYPNLYFTSIYIYIFFVDALSSHGCAKGAVYPSPQLSYVTGCM